MQLRPLPTNDPFLSSFGPTVSSCPTYHTTGPLIIIIIPIYEDLMMIIQIYHFCHAYGKQDTYHCG